MAPASCERAGEKFNPATIPPQGQLSPVEMRTSERRSEVRAARCPVPRLGVASGLPPINFNPSMRHGRILGHDKDTNVASAEGR
eukprot:6212086-Pleurochrysis_carterae.AAC.1